MPHTLGPWACDSRNGKHYLVSCSSDTPHSIVLGWPCGMEDGTWFTKDDYGDADALLIAAAPELISELVAARAYVAQAVVMAGQLSLSAYEMRDRLQTMDAVIAKAQGKS